MDRVCDCTKTTQSTLLPPSGEHVIAGAAHSGLRGWRVAMEDAVVTQLLTGELGVFAVLDGHGGAYCSGWAADELPHRLEHVAGHIHAASDGDEAWQVAQQLSEAVRQMDLDLRGCGRQAWACGTTLVSLIVTRRSLTVANVGDSRAVLCRAGTALPLSRDHKPKVSAERERILHAGGFIVDGRVNGDLSLSRALGDFRHKCVAHLPPSKQPVSSEPEVRSTRRLRSDQFVLLACDGLWDVISSVDAVEFVASRLERAPEEAAASLEPSEIEARRLALGVLCEALLDESLARGTTDNVSVVIVLLDPTLRAKPSLVEPHTLHTDRAVPPPPPSATTNGEALVASHDETNGDRSAHAELMCGEEAATWPAGMPPVEAVAALSEQIPHALYGATSQRHDDAAIASDANGTATANGHGVVNGAHSIGNGAVNGAGANGVNSAAANGSSAMNRVHNPPHAHGVVATRAHGYTQPHRPPMSPHRQQQQQQQQARQKHKATPSTMEHGEVLCGDGRNGSSSPTGHGGSREPLFGLQGVAMGAGATRGYRRVLLFAFVLFACLAMVGSQLLSPGASPAATAAAASQHSHELHSLPSAASRWGPADRRQARQRAARLRGQQQRVGPRVPQLLQRTSHA